MKRSLILSAIAMLALSAPAFADTSVGVVNVQQIMRDSKAANSVRDQLKTKQQSFQTELDSTEKSLQAEDQALAAESKTTKDKTAFDAKVKAFQTKAATAQRDVQTKKAAIDKAVSAALEQIQGNVLTIAKEVAAEKKFNLIVTSGEVLYNDPALDITADVQQRLDTKLPTVKVNF